MMLMVVIFLRLPTITRLYEKAVQSSSSGKGFGKVSKPQVPTPIPAEPIENDTTGTSTTPSNTSNTNTPITPTTLDPKEEYAQLTKQQKKDNLPYFQKRRQELKESIISKRRQLEQLQAGAKADPSVGAVPEMIADRMIRRIVIFFGIPVFGGLGIFAAAFFTYKKYDIVMEPGLIAYATQFPFVVGLLGITYAIISSSWDPEEGSLLGIQEFFTNIQRIKDGTKRNKEIASLQLELDKEEQEFRQYR